MTDKNETSYMTMTGNDNETTLDILGVIVVVFVLKSNIKDTSKVSHNKAKKAGSKPSFLGAFTSCLHYLDCCQ